ncbi:SMI1/KNR4 family protein [Streptomyces jumonjinensis]|uniref:SMI1/KNR4 family protein n=1 Tax=Streptomyces jumonjinensis TaxID=1945 RepID=A0A646KKL7_STRJU|nr:SMI1/KNR4 family protein [Streptomyces jumonjinensis]
MGEWEARQAAAAWRRVESWLPAHAPASFATLCPGAGEEDLAVAEGAFGRVLPPSLTALWRLCAGVRGGGPAVFLLDNWALMDLDAAMGVYRARMETAGDGLWKAHWIPFASYTSVDASSGLYLDAESGEVCWWGEFGERVPRFASLSVYLEETADRLEAPSLLPGLEPGLIDGGLAWGYRGDPPEGWTPLAG